MYCYIFNCFVEFLDHSYYTIAMHNSSELYQELMIGNLIKVSVFMSNIISVLVLFASFAMLK